MICTYIAGVGIFYNDAYLTRLTSISKLLFRFFIRLFFEFKKSYFAHNNPKNHVFRSEVLCARGVDCNGFSFVKRR